jgi:hypothetical protein
MLGGLFDALGAAFENAQQAAGGRAQQPVRLLASFGVWRGVRRCCSCLFSRRASTPPFAPSFSTPFVPVTPLRTAACVLFASARPASPACSFPGRARVRVALLILPACCPLLLLFAADRCVGFALTF